MYLHEDRETFRDLILQVADKNARTPVVIEKDYYVTLILRLLSEKLGQCVFKGGTSLSKGFHVQAILQQSKFPMTMRLQKCGKLQREIYLSSIDISR